MKLISAFILNCLFSSIWSVFIIVLWAGLLTDFMDEDGQWIMISVLIVNVLLTGMIHLLIFLPGTLIWSKRLKILSVGSLYNAIYPGLLIPLFAYLLIINTLVARLVSTQEFISVILFVGLGFMFFHSLSLYTFLHQINLPKTDSHEKNIENTL